MTKRPTIESAGDLHGRSVPEWIGKTSDTPAPKAVKLRILLRYKRTCHWTGVKIRAGDGWDTDHVIALTNGGQNRESNLAPIRRGKAHNGKTALDRKEADQVKRTQKKHYFAKPRSRLSPPPKPRPVLARDEAAHERKARAKHISHQEAMQRKIAG